MNFILSTLFLFAEIQFSLCPADFEKTVAHLEISDVEVKERTTYFFDTKDGFFHRQGIILRLRVTDKKSSLTVKVRNVSHSEVPVGLRNDEDLKCEYDVHLVRETPSCSLGHQLKMTDMAALIGSPQHLWELLSPAQVALLDLKGTSSLGSNTFKSLGTEPFKELGADDIIALGPIHQKVAKWDSFSGGHDASLELSQVDKSYRRLEFSTRHPASERHRAATEVNLDLAQKGISPCNDHQPSPLEYLLGKSH